MQHAENSEHASLLAVSAAEKYIKLFPHGEAADEVMQLAETAKTAATNASLAVVHLNEQTMIDTGVVADDETLPGSIACVASHGFL